MRHKQRFLLAALISAVMFSSCGGSDDDSDGDGNPPYPGIPQNGTVSGERNFAVLMNRFTQGQVRKMPWAGYWFPYEDNGTSAAAAKYENAGGRAGAISWERSNHGSNVPGIQSWWGHCNGWAASAVLAGEPRQAAKMGDVEFSVSDQKALLTEVGMEVAADFFGNRVNNPGDRTSAAFRDVAPNQFFLVLTNFVGQGFPLVVDRYTGNEVWNHPLAGYQLAKVSREDYLGLAPGTANVHRVNVAIKMWWVRDDVSPNHVTEAFAFADGPSYESRTLRAEVWLDGPVEFNSSGSIARAGNVILSREAVNSGAWKNGGLPAANSHPDYIWIPRDYARPTSFANPFVDAEKVLSAFGRR